MKKIIFKIFAVVFFSTAFLSCEGLLEEKLYSELGSTNYLKTREGVSTVLNGAYNIISPDAQFYMYKFFYSHISAGIGWGMGGTFEQNTAVPLHDFTWTTTQDYLLYWWSQYYYGIRNANIVLDNINNPDFPELYIAETTAEAQALRAYFYYQLYMLFGTVPVTTSSTPSTFIVARATEDEMRTRIEDDLREAAPRLLTKPELGRVSKGAALGLLCKFYLNTKQWDKCVGAAREIMAMNQYGLVDDYSKIYNISNEGHKEVIWVVPELTAPASESSDILALLLPPDFPLPSNQVSFAARNYVYDWFVDSFDENDQRKKLIMTEYVNNQGKLIPGYGANKSLYLKYPIDPNATGTSNGTDFIAVRYADILLALAEALNELNGPNQESVDLVNDIRKRAGVSPVELSGFASKESLRAHILNERLWEFYIEGLEREDMIRHGVFITRAKQRGINAKDEHTLFPIPQREIDSNPLMKQNPGY